MTIDSQLDVIFTTYDRAMNAGDFKFVDKALNDLVFTGVPVDILIGHLAAAYPARKRLDRWRFTVQRVEAELKERKTENIEELLKGFKETL